MAAVTLVKSASAEFSWVAHEGGRRSLPARVESGWCERRGHAQVTPDGGAASGHLSDHERALYFLGHERSPKDDLRPAGFSFNHRGLATDSDAPHSWRKGDDASFRVLII